MRSYKTNNMKKQRKRERDRKRRRVCYDNLGRKGREIEREKRWRVC